eukprot:gnl/Carplike_NY0171/3698_a4989_324.p1 GENE.gnl/Carplike_NY0171/3698_a4989_324~~gnl/Carplike_NY0171/3698_a4989_324.p1  ORF type:complete len:404 (-),score=64.29 gnl/Carplike_NY0171/3698_a4989_324:67-1185(-)
MVKDGSFKEARGKIGFRGTSRYASVHAHRQNDLSMVDDLWALFYTLLEFLCGFLPWAIYKDKERIGTVKEKNHDSSILCKGLPVCFKEIMDYLFTLSFTSYPDHEYILQLLKKEFSIHKFRKHSPVKPDLDWVSGSYQHELYDISKSPVFTTEVLEQIQKPSLDALGDFGKDKKDGKERKERSKQTLTLSEPMDRDKDKSEGLEEGRDREGIRMKPRRGTLGGREESRGGGLFGFGRHRRRGSEGMVRREDPDEARDEEYDAEKDESERVARSFVDEEEKSKKERKKGSQDPSMERLYYTGESMDRSMKGLAGRSGDITTQIVSVIPETALTMRSEKEKKLNPKRRRCWLCPCFCSDNSRQGNSISDPFESK